MIKFNKTFAEYFAGIGLVRMGLERAGWEIRYANDIDPMKKRLYSYHFGNEDHYELGDIHNVEVESLPEVDLATASFPCTDLSLAGKREGLDGKHSSAFWGFIDIVDALKSRKPKLLLLENVEGFLTSKGGGDLHEALTALNEIGYHVDIIIVNAKFFTPQSRVRLFIIATRNDLVDLVDNKELSVSGVRPEKLIKFIGKCPEISWCTRELPPLPSLSMNIEDVVDDIPDSSKEWWNKKRTDYLISQTSPKHFQYLEGSLHSDEYHYFTAFRRVRGGKSMAEIRNDGIAGCLRTPKGGSARQILVRVGKSSIKVKYMSASEYARLMGAADFKLSGSSTDCLFGFGDAVCVPVLTWIGEHYLNRLVSEVASNQAQKLVYAN